MIAPVIPDVPDVPARSAQSIVVSAHDTDAAKKAFGTALDGIGRLLGGASGAEDAFAAGSGDLQSAVYERARADVALGVATAAAQKAAQALQTILTMQV